MAKRTDYDGAWKDAFRRFLEPAFAFFFQSIHAEVDWSHDPERMDKELQAVTPKGTRGRQIVDVLVKVWRTDGTPAAVVIHIEIQSQTDPLFEARMFRYYGRIFDAVWETEPLPITSLAILADASSTWRPSLFRMLQWGCRAELEFPTVKLLDYKIADLETNPNPFAAVVLAHRLAQETHGVPQTRATQKIGLIRRLLARQMSEDDIAALLGIVDRLMHLPDALEARTWQQIQELEGDVPMAYMTYIEKQGYAKGKAEGKEEGKIEALHSSMTRALTRKFGDASNGVAAAIRQISDATILDDLNVEIAAATTLDTVQQALDTLTQHPA